MKSESESHSLLSNSLQPHGLYTVHGILQARIPEWIVLFFSRGSSQPRDQTQVFALQANSLPIEPPGKPKNTGVGSYPFSSGSSWPRDQTRVSCIAGRFFTNWAIREAPTMVEVMKIMHLLQKAWYRHFCTQCPDPASGHHWPMPPTKIPRHSEASLGQSLVGSLLLSPRSWCTQVLFVPSNSLFPQFYVSSVIKSHWPLKSSSLEVLSPFARSPGWEICCGS